MGGSHSKSYRVFFVGVLIALAFATSIPFSTYHAEASGGSSYIVMRSDNYEIIKCENRDLRLPMASTTKIMTALLICENCRPDEVIVIPKEAVGIEGSSIYLKEGEKLTIKELLLGLMLRSGNDCATALAIHAGGTIENFAEMMNLRAVALGLNDTHFVNPHGLHDENHYTSCYDLCKLSCFAMKNPQFKEIVSTKHTDIGTGESKRSLTNKNKILFQYEGGNGIKTGYTRAAGRCLVAAAERNGVQMVAVVLNVPDMFGKCRELMDYGFSVSTKKDG